MPSQSHENAYVLGVGIAAFLRPRGIRMYTELAFEAGVKAMLDAHVTYDDIEAGIGCFAAGATCSAQRVFYQFGMTGIPIYNTNNACATGSTGLNMARNFVRAGVHDCVLVVGFEQMNPGPLVTNTDTDRPTPSDLSFKMMVKTRGLDKAPKNPQMFGNAGREYMEKYGASAEDFAEVARISHEHSSRNPYAQFQTVYTLEEIQNSPMIHYPITKLQCSPTSDGAAAAIVVSERFLAARPGLKHAIMIAGQALASDSPALYSGSAIELVGYDMTKRATAKALAEAGATVKDVRVCELHDCFSTNEILALDAMGFSEPGKAHHLVRNGDITYGGKGPIVNPSGGLISKGHPLGATGLAQCAELTWQLRGWATNNRLVKGVDVALQHNLGLGGAVVVTVYRRADRKKNTDSPVRESDIAKASGLGYNPAVEARYITREQANAVRSRKAPCAYALDKTLDLIEARQSKEQGKL